MREVTFDVLDEEPKVETSSVNSTDNWSKLITPDFVPKDSYHIEKRNDQFVSISYNTRKNMFVLIDSNGATTWEWKKLTNKVNRVIRYNVKDSKEIVDIVYCLKYNCYFSLMKNNSIAVLNRDFDEVYRVQNASTVLCMLYNPLNDELLSSSLNGIKVWKLEPMTPDKIHSTKPLGSYQLILKKELNFKDWVKKIDIDSLNCHLYCCTAKDLFIYDFNGNMLRHYENVHKLAVTCCVYSPTARVVITGSLDCEIKIWSLAGGLLETFKGHSMPISSIILNPHNSNLILSASLDGTIKMWSLDIMQPIYQLTLFKSEILWMGVTEENLLYIASPFDVTLWTITDFIDFWAITRDKVQNIDFDFAKGKACRMIITSEENTIRIFNREKACQMTAVLPIPNLNNKLKMVNIVYSRHYDIMYILLSNNEVWLYYTRTNPCTHLVVLNTYELMEPELFEDRIDESAQDKLIVCLNTVNVGTGELLRKHRAVEYGLDHLDKNEKSKCRCICLLDCEVIYWKLNGSFRTPAKSLLLLGLENGNVIFCDALTQTKKYLTLNCSKDPIIVIKHDRLNNYLMVMVELVNLYHIQYYSLPELEMEYEVFCAKTVTAYARIDSVVFLGYEDGSLEAVEVKVVNTKESYNRVPGDAEIESILSNKVLKYEHRERIEIIDTCRNLKIFLTCSLDGIIKLWNIDKSLIIEIKLGDTLSHVRFLNSSGDLICGFRNHLFKIALRKVLPEHEHLGDNNDDYYDEYEDIFIDDSLVIEESNLNEEEQQQKSVKIDLNNYLHPFDVRCDKNGVLRVYQPEKRPKQVEKLEIRKKNDLDANSVDSYISSVRSSFLDTPRTNPLNDLKMVDLTLDAKDNQLALRAYLVEWLTASLMNVKVEHGQFPRDFCFPKFGNSPNSTPSMTPPPQERKQISFEDEDEELSTKYTAEERAQLEKLFSDKIQITLTDELMAEFDIENKKPKDKVATKESQTQTGKDPKELSKPRQQEPFEYKIKDFQMQRNEKPIDRGPAKPPQAPKAPNRDSNYPSLAPKEPIKLQVQELLYKSDLKPVAKAQYSLLASADLKTPSTSTITTAYRSTANMDTLKAPAKNPITNRPVTKRTGHQKPTTPQRGQNRLRSAASHSSKNSLASSSSIINSNRQGNSVGNVRKNSLKTASFVISEGSDRVDNQAVSRVQFTDKPGIGNPINTSSEIHRTAKSLDESSQAFLQDQYKQMQIQQNSSRLSMDSEVSANKSSMAADKENLKVQEPSKDTFNLLTQRSLNKNRHFKRFDSTLDIDGDEKTRFLFEYLYGMKGTPQRVGSGKYRIPYKNELPHALQLLSNTEKPKELFKADQNDPNQADNDSLDEEEKHFLQYANTASLSNSVFGDWLTEYERKKNRLRNRINKARENNEFLTIENHRALKFNIIKKNMSLTNRLGPAAYLNREAISFVAQASQESPATTTRSTERQKKGLNNALTKFLQAESMTENKRLKSDYPQSESSFNTVPIKRSKSVSFAFQKTGNESLQRAQTAKPTTEMDPKSTKPKPIIRLQPTYMVSQIEMEEIFNEALKKVEEKKSSRSAEPIKAHTASAMSFTNMDLKSASNNPIEITSDNSDTELETSFFKPDSSIAKKNSNLNSRKSSAHTTIVKASKEANAQLYQAPCKLDNWATEHRLSLKSAGSLVSKSRASHMSKLIDFSDSEEEEEEFNNLTSNENATLKYNRFQLVRPRTANSIPCKNGKYVFIKAPQLNLEYQLPNSPEKHLLPIRFPKLYNKIIKSITLYNKKLEAELEQKKKEEFLGIEIF